MPSLVGKSVTEHCVARNDVDTLLSVAFRKAVLEVVNPLLQGSTQPRKLVNLDDPPVLVDLDSDRHLAPLLASHEALQESKDAVKNLQTEMLEIIRGEVRNYVEEFVKTSLQSGLGQQGLKEKADDQTQFVDADALFRGDHPQNQEDFQEVPRQVGEVPTGTDITDTKSASVNDILLSLGLRAGLVEDVAQGNWTLQHSVWDAAAFIGHEDTFLPMESVFVSTLVSVNFLAQLSFVIIVWNSLAASSLDQDTLDGYHFWRTNTAHASQFIDNLTSESLASRVCRGDSSLHISQLQAQQVRDIDAYLFDNVPFNGPLMCFLAVLTWTLTVSKEFQVLNNMISACRSLPRGKTKVALDGSGRLILQSLGNVRFAYLLFLCTCRGTIAGMLLVAGAKFLAVTLSIEEFFLNAVALEFVLNIDELLYLALAPRKTRKLVCLWRPLRTSNSTAFSGLDVNMIAATIVILGFLSGTILIWILPEIQRMHDAKRELCAGRHDFVYALTSINVVLWSSTVTLDMQKFKEQFTATIRYQMLRGLMDNRIDNGTLAFELPAVQGAGASLVTVSKWGIEQFGISWNLECADFTNNTSFSPVIGLAALRDKLHNQSITTCADVASYCNAYDYGIVRLWCPRTCECDRFMSSLIFPYALDGCLASCRTTQKFKAERGAVTCVQVDNNKLTSMPVWQEYVKNRNLAISTWSDRVTKDVTALMSVHGCDAHGRALGLGVDICKDVLLKSVAAWCPRACHCNASNSKVFCPATCV